MTRSDSSVSNLFSFLRRASVRSGMRNTTAASLMLSCSFSMIASSAAKGRPDRIASSKSSNRGHWFLQYLTAAQNFCNLDPRHDIVSHNNYVTWQ
jgi:hypothetical protein